MNKGKAQEAEARAKEAESSAERARADAVMYSKENVKLSPEAQSMLTDADSDRKASRGGDVTKTGWVANFLAQNAKANETARRVSPTGSASLATQNANPTLLAMNDRKLNMQQAQDQALGVTNLAISSQQAAEEQVANLSGMELGANSQLASFLFQNAGLAGQKADTNRKIAFEQANKPGFLSQLALGAVGAAGQVGGAAIGKWG